MQFSTDPLPENELRLLCEQVQVISMRIGKFIAEERKKVKPSDIETKGASNFVSYVDKAAEKMFVEELKKVFPAAGFIAEEDSSLIKANRFNWVIDPLDGTTNYLHGIPCFATSVALLENNIPVVGVVFEINNDECFYAWKGGGAWLNGERIFVSKAASLKEALVATGFAYEVEEWFDKYVLLFGDVQKSSISLRRLGSAATDIAYVACGRFEAYYEYGIHAWDVAAGALLVQEAGGIVTDFSGEADFLFSSKFVCGNHSVHKELLEKIQNYFK
jgi:myo-inositol-1(or 4)-monophosphatase